MIDLISREAAIALLKSEFYEQCPKGSVQRLLFANAIEALSNMPSNEQLILQDMMNGMAVTRGGVRVDPLDVFPEKP